MPNDKRQDLVDTLLKAGIGLFAMTEEKVKKFVDDLVEKGEISGSRSKTLAEEIAKRFEKGREEWTSRFGQEMKKILTGLDIPTRSEVEMIKEDLREIKRELKRLRKQDAPKD
ncbi:MAG: phasin family protein [Deltaproteobacteria bacterium]|nr:phasin family protein [Deltaproteobacteria bacterium]